MSTWEKLRDRHRDLMKQFADLGRRRETKRWRGRRFNIRKAHVVHMPGPLDLAEKAAHKEVKRREALAQAVRHD